MSDLRTVLQHSWSKALLAASSVEEQAQALVGQLAAAAPGPEDAQKLLAEVKGKLEAQRRELQAHVHHAVKSALDRILPSRIEVEALHARLAELEARLASLKAGRGGRPSA